MAFEVVIHPAKVLRKMARRIEPTDGIDLDDLFDEMLDTMDEYEGVGLAAPQVGKSIRFIVAHNVKTQEDIGLVNPQILEGSPEKEIRMEGCLSIPGLVGDVERHQWVRVRWQDLSFKMYEEVFSGHFARVLQHEVDHLNGVLISDLAIGGMYKPEERADRMAEEEAAELAEEGEEVAGQPEGPLGTGGGA